MERELDELKEKRFLDLAQREEKLKKQNDDKKLAMKQAMEQKQSYIK